MLFPNDPLADEDADRLNFKAYADALAGLIDSPYTTTPLTLAINAPWGSGKITLARMIERRLERKLAAGQYLPHVTCWFNAWMHDDSLHLASAFAAEVAECANRHRFALRRFLQPIPDSLLGWNERTRRYILAVGVIIVLALLLAIRLSPFATLLVGEWQNHLKLAFTGTLGSLILAFIALSEGFRLAVPFAKAISEFVKDPRTVAASASMKDVSTQLAWLIGQATRGRRKFVIFIDDLDRCQPQRAVEVLEVVTQLLGHEGVVYVIIADMPAVAASAKLCHQHLADQNAPTSSVEAGGYGRRFIQKAVQLQFDIPAHPTKMIRALVGSLATEIDRHKNSSALKAETLRQRTERLWSKLISKAAAAKSQLVSPAPSATALMMQYGMKLVVTSAIFVTVGYGFVLLSGLGTRRIMLTGFALIAFALALATAAFGETWFDYSHTRRARHVINERIEYLVNSGQHDFLAVIEDLTKYVIQFRNPWMTNDLIRERVQIYLEDESELQREAEDEITRYLQPSPRHAKRLLNRLRLRLYVAHERRVFGGEPELTARHLGKLAVLCERWLELAETLTAHPELMADLESSIAQRSTTANVSNGGPKHLAEGSMDDPDLRAFLQSETKLAPIMERLIHFEPAS